MVVPLSTKALTKSPSTIAYATGLKLCVGLSVTTKAPPGAFSTTEPFAWHTPVATLCNSTAPPTTVDDEYTMTTISWYATSGGFPPSAADTFNVKMLPAVLDRLFCSVRTPDGDRENTEVGVTRA